MSDSTPLILDPTAAIGLGVLMSQTDDAGRMQYASDAASIVANAVGGPRYAGGYNMPSFATYARTNDSIRLFQDIWKSFDGIHFVQSEFLMLLQLNLAKNNAILSDFPTMPKMAMVGKYPDLRVISDTVYMDKWVTAPTTLPTTAERTPGLLVSSERVTDSMTMVHTQVGFDSAMDWPLDATKAQRVEADLTGIGQSMIMTKARRLFMVLLRKSADFLAEVHAKRGALTESQFIELTQQAADAMFGLQKPGVGFIGFEAEAHETGMQRNVNFDRVALAHRALKFAYISHPAQYKNAERGPQVAADITGPEKPIPDAFSAQTTPLYKKLIRESQLFPRANGQSAHDPLETMISIAVFAYLSHRNYEGKDVPLANYSPERLSVKMVDGDAPGEALIRVRQALEYGCMFHTTRDHKPTAWYAQFCECLCFDRLDIDNRTIRTANWNPTAGSGDPNAAPYFGLGRSSPVHDLAGAPQLDDTGALDIMGDALRREVCAFNLFVNQGNLAEVIWQFQNMGEDNLRRWIQLVELQGRDGFHSPMIAPQIPVSLLGQRGAHSALNMPQGAQASSIHGLSPDLAAAFADWQAAGMSAGGSGTSTVPRPAATFGSGQLGSGAPAPGSRQSLLQQLYRQQASASAGAASISSVAAGIEPTPPRTNTDVQYISRIWKSPYGPVSLFPRNTPDRHYVIVSDARASSLTTAEELDAYHRFSKAIDDRLAAFDPATQNESALRASIQSDPTVAFYIKDVTPTPNAPEWRDRAGFLPYSIHSTEHPLRVVRLTTLALQMRRAAKAFTSMSDTLAVETEKLRLVRAWSRSSGDEDTFLRPLPGGNIGNREIETFHARGARLLELADNAIPLLQARAAGDASRNNDIQTILAQFSTEQQEIAGQDLKVDGLVATQQVGAGQSDIWVLSIPGSQLRLPSSLATVLQIDIDSAQRPQVQLAAGEEAALLSFSAQVLHLQPTLSVSDMAAVRKFLRLWINPQPGTRQQAAADSIRARMQLGSPSPRLDAATLRAVIDEISERKAELLDSNEIAAIRRDKQSIRQVRKRRRNQAAGGDISSSDEDNRPRARRRRRAAPIASGGPILQQAPGRGGILPVPGTGGPGGQQGAGLAGQSPSTLTPEKAVDGGVAANLIAQLLGLPIDQVPTGSGTELPAAYIYALLWNTRLDYRFFDLLFEVGLSLPIEAIADQGFIDFTVGHGVWYVAGDSTAVQAEDDAGVLTSHDNTLFTIHWSIKWKSGVVVRKPRNLHLTPHMLGLSYRRGAGVVPFDVSHHQLALRNHHIPPADLFFYLVPRKFNVKRTVLGRDGYDPVSFCTPADGVVSQLHHPFGPLYSQIWGFSNTPNQPHMFSSDFYLEYERPPRYNTLTWRGSYRVWCPHANGSGRGEVREFIEGHSPLGHFQTGNLFRTIRHGSGFTGAIGHGFDMAQAHGLSSKP